MTPYTFELDNSARAIVKNSINNILLFKNYSRFTNCLTIIRNMQIDYTKELNVVDNHA